MNKDPNCKLNGHGFNSDGICIYCHEDDGTQKKADQNTPTNTLEITPMQEALGLYMRVKGVSARGFAAGLQIDHTAVSRFISGKDISLKNYSKILAWFVQVPDYPPRTEEV